MRYQNVVLKLLAVSPIILILMTSASHATRYSRTPVEAVILDSDAWAEVRISKVELSNRDGYNMDVSALLVVSQSNDSRVPSTIHVDVASTFSYSSLENNTDALVALKRVGDQYMLYSLSSGIFPLDMRGYVYVEGGHVTPAFFHGLLTQSKALENATEPEIEMIVVKWKKHLYSKQINESRITLGLLNAQVPDRIEHDEIIDVMIYQITQELDHVGGRPFSDGMSVENRCDQFCEKALKIIGEGGDPENAKAILNWYVSDTRL